MRGRAGWAVLLAVSLSTLTGCAGIHEATGTASQQDLLQMQTVLQSLQVSLERTRTELDTTTAEIDRRLREQSADTARQVGALSARLEALSGDVNALASRTEDLTHRLDAVKKSIAARPAPAPAPPVAAAPAAPGARPTTGALQPEDIYQAAYLDFSKGSYALAVAGFREFLRRFPDNKLADSAQYWIGESHLGLAHGHANSGQDEKATGELEEAVREFRKVITNYPRGEKVPTALYKEALALLDLKKPADARAQLQYLVDNFPRSEEAPLARDRLTNLK